MRPAAAGTAALLILLCACKRPAPRAVAGVAGNVAATLAAADSLFSDERFDSARVRFREVLTAARTAGDGAVEARAQLGIGKASYWLGDLRESRQALQRVIDLEAQQDTAKELPGAYSFLGLVSKDEGRINDAATLFRRAIDAAQAVGDSDVLVRATGNVGLAAQNLGDMKGAREAFRSQRRLAAAGAWTRYEANALANEANLDIWEGDPRPALARLDTARAIYRRIGYAGGEQYALTELATAYEETGDVDSAFAALDTALAFARSLDMKGQVTENQRLLGGLHLKLGDYRRAVAYLDQAVSDMRSAGSVQLPAALRGSAEAYLRLDDASRAGANATEALQLDSAAQKPLDELDDLLLLTEIDYRRGGLSRAEPRLRAALALADQIGTRGSRIAVALAEARLGDLSGNARRVLRALRGAGPDIAAGDFGAEWEANALASRAYARLAELDSAVAAGRRAVAAVERLRGELASEPLRSTLVADRAGVYGDLSIALLRQGHVDEAFAVADAARSGELLRRLASAREDVSAGALPSDLVAGEELLRRIDDLVSRLRESERGRGKERGVAVDSSDAVLAGELETARSQYEALILRVAQQHPRASALVLGRPPRIDEVRAALDTGEALLEYLVAPDRLLIFVVTRAGLQVLQSPVPSSTLGAQARLLRELWGSPGPDWKFGLDAARALYATLLAPVRDAGLLRGVRQLLIVPHGILGQVPFAALVDGVSERYVMQDFTIAALPSAAALAVVRETTGTGQPAADGVAFAPFPRELPATRGEVDAFRAAFPRATLRIGQAATEGALRHALASGGPVHVATHAILNVRNPMFSRVELARSVATTSVDDGRLEVHELLGLEVHSPLVFLSGCETGAGQEWTDDPVRGAPGLTLAQAFLAAGASNVVLTLWRIDDAGAAAFAGAFYRALPREGVAGALATAQRTLSADARWASPYYWAGYQLSGSGRTQGAQDRRTASVSEVSDTRGRVP